MIADLSATSRPLRALACVLGGWTAARVVILWPAGSSATLPPAETATVSIAPPIVAAPFDAQTLLFPARHLAACTRNAAAAQPIQSSRIARATETVQLDSLRPITHLQSPAPAQSKTVGERLHTPVALGLPITASHKPFSGSVWSLMRNDGGQGLAAGGQLGGSQAGVRVFYTPGPEAIALTARISTPLAQFTGREAAIGIALRGHNFGIIAEQRFALNKGGRNAPAVIVYGGVSDVKLPADIKLDGYAQAGVVGVKAPAAFIDGAVRIERPILTAAHSSLAVGVGAWGGAQPGLSRLDIGAQIVAHIAVTETNLRVSAEWRERVAGNASPASGPSVTVGIDF